MYGVKKQTNPHVPPGLNRRDLVIKESCEDISLNFMAMQLMLNKGMGVILKLNC